MDTNVSVFSCFVKIQKAFLENACILKGNVIKYMLHYARFVNFQHGAELFRLLKYTKRRKINQITGGHLKWQ